MALACAVGLLLADQWTKRSIQIRAANRTPVARGLVHFRFAPHREQSYKRLTTRAGLVLAWALALVCAIVLYRFGIWFQSGVSLAGLGLAFGGAAGNLIDILRRGYVVNFIDLGWWPVFNVADAAIVVGLAAALLR